MLNFVVKVPSRSSKGLKILWVEDLNINLEMLKNRDRV